MAWRAVSADRRRLASRTAPFLQCDLGEPSISSCRNDSGRGVSSPTGGATTRGLATCNSSAGTTTAKNTNTNTATTPNPAPHRRARAASARRRRPPLTGHASHSSTRYRKRSTVRRRTSTQWGARKRCRAPASGRARERRRARDVGLRVDELERAERRGRFARHARAGEPTNDGPLGESFADHRTGHRADHHPADQAPVDEPHRGPPHRVDGTDDPPDHRRSCRHGLRSSSRRPGLRTKLAPTSLRSTSRIRAGSRSRNRWNRKVGWSPPETCRPRSRQTRHSSSV